MEEEFYAILKLISGEEILSKVCPCDEDNRIILILDDPIIMETILIRKLEMTTIKVTPWIKFSNNRMFVMDMKNVITMTEVDDEDLIHIHQKYAREKNKKSNQTEITPKMGYLASIDDARKSLEKIYKSN
jgi:hypothetical protein